MSVNVALCIDSETAAHLELIGLAGELFANQIWLEVLTDACAARDYVRAHHEGEVWVIGSDSVSGINLAATLVRDGAQHVVLVSFEGGGSLYSRATAAGVAEVIGQQEFTRRYAEHKAPAAPAAWLPNVVVQTPVAQEPLVYTAPVPAPETTETLPLVHVAEEAAGPVAPQVVPALANAGSLLVVCGAGGGMGKSTLAALCALEAQARGLRTAVVDADLQCGDLHYLLGAEDPLRVDAVVASPGRAQALDCAGRMPALLASPEALEHSEEAATALPGIIEQLRGRFDVVVVNTGPAWDDLHMELLMMASTTLFVLDQRPTAIRLCRHVLDLCSRCGVPAQSFVYAVNRCARGSLFTSIDVSCALSGGHAEEIAEGGRIVEELLGCGQALDLLDSRNALCASVRKLADVLFSVQTATQPQPSEPARKRRKKLGAKGRRAACL